MFSPELFIYDNLLQNSSETNLIHAFRIAEEKFGIEKILDPEGIKFIVSRTLVFCIDANDLQRAFCQTLSDPAFTNSDRLPLGSFVLQVLCLQPNL